MQFNIFSLHQESFNIKIHTNSCQRLTAEWIINKSFHKRCLATSLEIFQFSKIIFSHHQHNSLHLQWWLFWRDNQRFSETWMIWFLLHLLQWFHYLRMLQLHSPPKKKMFNHYETFHDFWNIVLNVLNVHNVWTVPC